MNSEHSGHKSSSKDLPRSCERGGFQWVIWFDDGLKNSLLSVDSCLLNSRQFILLWYIVIQNRILFYGMLNKIVKS